MRVILSRVGFERTPPLRLGARLRLARRKLAVALPPAHVLAARLPRPRMPAIPERWLEATPYALATLLVAGVTHIASVLILPAVAPRDAAARLAEAVRAGDLAPGGLTLLAPDAAALPYEDPALALGACLFDLRKGALRVTADVDGEDWLGVSFHAGGRVFHALSDRAALKGKIDVVIGDAAQIAALEDEDDDAPPTQQARIVAPEARGFVLVRSLARRSSDMALARARLQRVGCAQIGK